MNSMRHVQLYHLVRENQTLFKKEVFGPIAGEISIQNLAFVRQFPVFLMQNPASIMQSPSSIFDTKSPRACRSDDIDEGRFRCVMFVLKVTDFVEKMQVFVSKMTDFVLTLMCLCVLTMTAVSAVLTMMDVCTIWQPRGLSRLSLTGEKK